jgi:type VI secretion system protein ImpF
MTPRGQARTLQPSVIDRLIAPSARGPSATGNSGSQSMRELKDSVRRDLEWLLNSRRTPEDPPKSALELSRSVYCYGLPDIASFSLGSADAKSELARRIETAVAMFEPRLRNVQVHLLPAVQGSRILRFQIEALLRTDPAPARVCFDTSLEPLSGEYEIAGESSAR